MNRLLILGLLMTHGACASKVSSGGDAGGDQNADHDANPTEVCQTMQDSYWAALRVGQGCDPTASGQCEETAPSLSVGCTLECTITVNDNSKLTPLVSAWALAGCGAIEGFGCVGGCRDPILGTCVAQDGGTGVCDPS
jgi:hypothetical protein